MGAAIAAACGHPLTPFVVGDYQSDDEGETDDGEEDFHSKASSQFTALSSQFAVRRWANV